LKNNLSNSIVLIRERLPHDEMARFAKKVQRSTQLTSARFSKLRDELSREILKQKSASRKQRYQSTMPMRVPRLAALRAPSASASLIAPARLIVSAAPVSRNATRSFVTSSSRTKPASESIQIGQKNLVTGEITGAVDIDVSWISWF
jgi:hypothetical protein